MQEHQQQVRISDSYTLVTWRYPWIMNANIVYRDIRKEKNVNKLLLTGRDDKQTRCNYKQASFDDKQICSDSSQRER